MQKHKPKEDIEIEMQHIASSDEVLQPNISFETLNTGETPVQSMRGRMAQENKVEFVTYTNPMHST